MSRVEMGSDMFYKGAPKLPSEKLTWRYTFVQQGVSAELVAQQYGVTREAMDRFAVDSHRKAASARASGAFDEEIVGVPASVATILGVPRLLASLPRIKTALEQ